MVEIVQQSLNSLLFGSWFAGLALAVVVGVILGISRIARLGTL